MFRKHAFIVTYPSTSFEGATAFVTRLALIGVVVSRGSYIMNNKVSIQQFSGQYKMFHEGDF